MTADNQQVTEEEFSRWSLRGSAKAWDRAWLFGWCVGICTGIIGTLGLVHFVVGT